jgi:hypothetical protein
MKKDQEKAIEIIKATAALLYKLSNDTFKNFGVHELAEELDGYVEELTEEMEGEEL